jgi:Pyruvate/2-oxoacid:ferredoxin oxidoreductase delta subunit
MRKRIQADYKPSQEQSGLFPDVSGDTLNGLGESQSRNPIKVYWSEPETIAHGEVQKYFYNKSNSLRSVRKEVSDMKERRGVEVIPEVSSNIIEDSPSNWSEKVKRYALANEADLVGIVQMNPEWAYEGHSVGEDWIILMACVMDQRELVKLPPTAEDMSSADEVARQFNRLARACKQLTAWIRNQGWQAEARPGPWSGDFTMIPAAIEAGFGQLGKHGSLINDKYGASFRLASVTTNMPLQADNPRDIAVDDVCETCTICTDLCPPDAIYSEKQLVRGEHKWYVNFDKCLPYFNDTLGCGICIANCPWSLPGVAPSLTQKMLRRRERKQEKG